MAESAPRGATPPDPDRLVPLGGGSRRYLDPVTDLTYSRRQAEYQISGTHHVARAPGSRAEYWQRVEQYRAYRESQAPVGARTPTKREVTKDPQFQEAWQRYAHPERFARAEGTAPGAGGQTPQEVQRTIALRMMGQRAEAAEYYRSRSRR